MRPTSLAVLCVSLALMAVAIGAIVVRAMSGEPAPEAAAPIVPTAPADARPTDGPALTPAATPGTSGPTGSASGPAEHDGSRALSILQELAKGPRVSGSPAEARAAEYISGLFRSYGYTTEVMSFEFEGDRFRAGEVRLDGQPSEALTLAGSPGGQVQASAVYVGLADAAGVSGKDLKGKVAVADRGTLNFFDKYTNARDAGAVGLILVNNRPGPFSGNLTTLASFPVVSVSQEAGAAIVDAARAGRTVAISAPPTTGLTVALNVIARPTTASECKVLVGGHFDSVPGAPGANDKASGVANVIELARAAPSTAWTRVSASPLSVRKSRASTGARRWSLAGRRRANSHVMRSTWMSPALVSPWRSSATVRSPALQSRRASRWASRPSRRSCPRTQGATTRASSTPGSKRCSSPQETFRPFTRRSMCLPTSPSRCSIRWAMSPWPS
ncbi:MAG: M28 family peptidase [Dehalococcoidia bacterium]|nr:M28 family peptidase [Dehalococcoidia bacterium]